MAYIYASGGTSCLVAADAADVKHTVKNFDGLCNVFAYFMAQAKVLQRQSATRSAVLSATTMT